MAGQQCEVCDGTHVVRSAGVLRDAQGVINGGFFRRGVKPCRLTDVFRGDAGKFGRPFGGDVLEEFPEFFKILGARLDEFLVFKPLCNDDVRHCVEKPVVGTRLDGHVQLRMFGKPDTARVGHDKGAPPPQGLFHLQSYDGVCLGWVAADEEYELAILDFANGVGHCATSK